MKRIGIILILIFFAANFSFAQLTDPPTEPNVPSIQDEETVQEDEETVEEEKQKPDSVTPDVPENQSTPEENDTTDNDVQEQETDVDPTSTPEDMIQDGDEENQIIPNEEADIEEPPDSDDPVQQKWQGSRRLIKLVNDFELKADEVLTTLIMIAGDANISGTVTGNVVVFGGNINLMPGSKVDGMLQVIGGEITGNLESAENYNVYNGWRIVPAAAQLLMHPHSIWDIRKHRNFRLTTLKFGLLLLTYLLIAIVFPKPVYAINSLLTNRPIESLLFCILMFVIIPIVSWVMILSIVGFPTLLLGICLLVPLALCGKVAIFYTLGSTLLAGRLKPLAVIFGFIPYFMATEIPYIDWIAFLIFNGFGISLCILSGFRMMLAQNHNKNINWSERIR